MPAEPPRPAPRAGWATQAAAWLVAGLGTLPVLMVLVGGFRLNGAWSLEPWRNLLSQPQGFDLGHALSLSLAYAVGATAIALAACAALVYARRRMRPWAGRLIEALAAIPMAASSVLLGLGFILAFGATTAFPLAYTPWILLAAHTILVLPFAARILIPAYDAHDGRLDEAAQILGASPARVALRIHWPILRKPILVATGFALALSLGDFGASAMLSTTDTAGLAVWTNRLDGAFNPILHARATALAGLLGLLAAAAYLLVERASLGAAREVL